MTLDTKPAPAAATEPATRLEALLRRVADPQLAEQLRQEMTSRDRRQFGLVFEHHLPETVELPGVQVRPGRKVRILPKRGTTAAADPTVWTVTGVDGPIAQLRCAPDPDRIDTTSRAVQDLVAVADFNDPIYPGLQLTDKLSCDDADRPWHTLISAENYHALQALQYTHAASVDTIYIDPPYNTLNDDWIYSDRHVSGEDSFRHSKWLSFMERRLVLAKHLLKPTGVIIVAIGDDEHHRLRMLMDQVFGENNFISNVVWQGGRKNDSRYVSNGADYMLIYARDEGAMKAAEIRWREEKAGVERVLEAGRDAWQRAQGIEQLATATMRSWFRGLAPTDPARAMARNVYFLPDGQLCRDDNITWPGGDGPRYDVLHPSTGEPVPVPDAGWRFQQDGMSKAIAEGRIVFREDHTKPISLKRPLEDATGQVVMSVFDRQRTHAGRHVIDILGDKRFPFPKDHTVLMRWIGMVTPADGTVLDFFGGSGSTLEAVLRLNAADGGARQCLLVTNNEVGSKAEKQMRKAGLRDGDPDWEAAGVCEYVTRPRIRTILTGVRPDGSSYADTVPGNVAMFDLTYEDPTLVELDLAFGRVAPMLWLAAGGVGECIDQVPDCGWAVTDRYAVLFSTDAQKPFLAALHSQQVAFIVTDDEGQFQQVARHLPPETRAVRLYESYLRTFQIGADTA